MSMEFILIVLAIILGGVFIFLIPSIKLFKKLGEPIKLEPVRLYDRKSLQSYLYQDKQTLLNQMSRVKKEWNQYCKELKEINYNLQELYNTMKNGVSVDESDSISSSYELLRYQKVQIEKICRELKHDLRNLNRVYTIIDTTW